MAMTGAERQKRYIQNLKRRAGEPPPVEPPAPPMTDARRREIAYHEAGHVVVAHYVGLPMRRVTIVPSGDWQGSATYHRSPLKRFNLDLDINDRAYRRAERDTLVTLAGGVAQKRYAPGSVGGDDGADEDGLRSGCAGDWGYAADLAFTLHRDSQRRAQLHLDYLEKVTACYVDEHWDEIERVAAALLEKGTLDQWQIVAAMKRPAGAFDRRAIR
jgi:hypothetical protein